MKGSRKPIAVSMGDPSGIGPDIILSCWANRRETVLPPFYVIGDEKVLETRARELNIDVALSTNRENAASDEALTVISTGKPCEGAPGKPNTKDAIFTIEAIEQAVHDAKANNASAIVTCPINKAVLYDAGFEFPGHTEFLSHLANQHFGSKHQSVMMLAGPKLKTIPVTIHVPLLKVFDELTTELIVSTAMIANRDLKSRFGIETPRIAVAGLNPHAGEAGAMGTEELDLIIPAIDQLRDRGLNVIGPLPADTMFHQQARTTYDVALCMYHDQALIPAKTLGFDDAANVTLGLPFIRTSPDHGTAYNIAGTGEANPSSFVAALKTAAEMAARDVG